MAQIAVDAGICGFTSRIQTSTADMQTVKFSYESDCPHVNKAKAEVTAGMALPKNTAISIEK